MLELCKIVKLRRNKPCCKFISTGLNMNAAVLKVCDIRTFWIFKAVRLDYFVHFPGIKTNSGVNENAALSGFKNKTNITRRLILNIVQDLCSPEQHSYMVIMTAGMHNSRSFGGILTHPAFSLHLVH